MSLDDRLRAAAVPDAVFDVEGDVSDVRKRAGRIRRRRRTGAVASAVVVMLAVAAIVWPIESDDATVDTADADVPWFLPASVPDGYRLAWVDLPSARPDETGGTDPWSGTYAYGYQSPTVEFDTRIVLGADLDGPASAGDLNDGGSADTIDGQGVVRWRSDGSTVRLLVDLDGAVAHVIVHPRGQSFPDPPPLPSDEVVDGYAASIARVSESAWLAALSSGVDVADRYGPLNGQVVVEGNGWHVLDGDFRAPFSVRHRAVWARVGELNGSAVGAPDEDGDFWSEEILEADGVRVAWGLAPTTSRTVRLRIADQFLTEDTVPSDGWRVWAVDVSQVDTSDARVEFLDASDTVVAAGPVTSHHPPDPDDLPVFSGDGDPDAQATEIAERLACDSTSDGMQHIDPSEPQPIAAIFCKLGDADLNITVYASQQDVTAALVAADPFCGHRAAGLSWIVVTNTLETAERAAAVLGGSALTLSGCAGP